MQKTNSNDSNEETDQLIKGTLVEGSEPIKGLEVYLKPGETSDDKMLQFKFQQNKFDLEKVSIDLIFDNPEHVSYN